MKLCFNLPLFLYLSQLISTYLLNKSDSIVKRNYNDLKNKNSSIILNNQKWLDSFDNINNIFDFLFNSDKNLLYGKKNIQEKDLKKFYSSIIKKYLENKSSLRNKKYEISERYLEELNINNNSNSSNKSDDNTGNIFYYLIDFLYAMRIRSKDIDDKIEKLLNQFNISNNCKNFINSTILEIYNKSRSLTIQFFNKIIIDLSAGKNDFLAFDECLEKKKLLSLIQLKNNLTIEPLYIIAIVDDTENKRYFKNSTLFEKYFFSIGICIPDVYYENKSIFSEDGICNGESHYKIIKSILNVTTDMTTASMENIYLRDKKDKDSNTEIFLEDLIPFYILLIPLLISIFLIIFKNQIIKPQKAGIIYNKLNSSLSLIEEEKDENILSDHKVEEEEEEKEENSSQNKSINGEKKKLFFPLWYKLLKDIFNYENNIKELFNFNLNNRNINNINGLGYTKGLMGLSIILTVLGYTFFSLFNLPMKYYGIWSFNDSISFILYFPFFFGIRYSPRIIFSCSGYTLAYKYLSFISQEPEYFFLKFNLLESYKYIILILIISFVKYSLYHLDILVYHNSPTWEIFKEKVIKLSESKLKTFLKFLTFKINNIKIDHERLSQDIFDYYWIALNEIFFFIFGTVLITLGYKFKLRIDYFIIFLVLFLYIGKIVYYYIYYHKKEEIYTTLYYCLFEYGKLMLNPLFNLPYFLIGMYFGLINFTILRGFGHSKILKDISPIDREESGLFNTSGNDSDNQIFSDSNKDISNNDTISKDNISRENTSKDNIIKLDISKDQSDDNIQNNINENNNNKINTCKTHTNSHKKKNFDSYDQRNLINEIRSEGTNLNFYNNKSKSDKTKNNNKSLDFSKITNIQKVHTNDTVFNVDLYDRNKLISFDKISFSSLNQSKSEIKEMPFLISPLSIVIFIRTTKNSKWYKFILIIFVLFVIFFATINFILTDIINDINYKNVDDKDEFMEKLSLEKVISNFTLNFFYLIDIEIIVLFIHFEFFYLYMIGLEFINGFFNHIYWSFFSKIYFSFITVFSPIILFNLYNSETLIKVNIYNIYVYSFINIVIIFLIMILGYIYLELPLKKLFKFLIRKYNIEFDNDEEKKEEENEDDDDDD